LKDEGFWVEKKERTTWEVSKKGKLSKGPRETKGRINVLTEGRA